MVDAMPVEKISVSMDPRLIKAIRREAKAAGKSVSEWVSRAAEKELKLAKLGKVLNEWEREHGGFTEEEIKRTAQILWGSRSTRAR
jgi:hypothetical protein